MHPRAFILVLLAAAGVVTAAPVSAITITTFGPFGEAGSTHGRPLGIGAGGAVFELDSFLRFDGQPGFRLSDGSLAGAGVDVSFGYGVSSDGTDLTLSYTFTNDSGSLLDDVRFISFLDAEIDEPLNTFFNEYGEVLGTPGAGAGDLDPDSWEIDEPGFVFGDIYSNAFAGDLDLTNGVPLGAPDDVSMALGFFLGPLDPGGSVSIRVLLSEDLDSVGSLALVHNDLHSEDTVISMSGRVVPTAVPEPGSLALLCAGLASLAAVRLRRRGNPGAPDRGLPTIRKACGRGASPRPRR